MIFRVRYYRLGEHVYCSLFVAPGPNRTFAYAGFFTLRVGEFEDLVDVFDAEFYQVRPPGRAARTIEAVVSPKKSPEEAQAEREAWLAKRRAWRSRNAPEKAAAKIDE